MSKIKAVLNYTGDFSFNEDIIREFKNKFPEVKFIVFDSKEPAGVEIEKADIFMGWPDDDMIKIMNNLKWLQLPSAGAGRYIDHPDLAEEVILTNSSGVFDVPGAEHTLALMFAFARQLKTHIKQQNQHIWKRNPECLEVQDSIVSIIGLGSIGSEIARKVKGIGAEVIGVKRDISNKPAYVDDLYTNDSLNKVLQKSDFVVNALPHTPETDKYFSRKRLKEIKPGAVFINIGRGKTVDEPALIDLLKKQHLRAAGLDVTAEEPLPDTSPLWDMDNVIITSHSVGVSPRKVERRASLFKENLKRFLEDKKLKNTINRSRGY
ncbi:MAG: D-2-hydroxyacid dehydrogenase [Halanaerobiales bacterium]